MGGGKWIEKKSAGSPSFEGLKRDLERLIKNIGKGDLLELLFFHPIRFNERRLFFSIRWTCSKKIKIIFNLCVMYTIIKADGISSIFKCVCYTQCHLVQSFNDKHKKLLSGGWRRRGMVSIFVP
jgi:hypothetical protein